MKNFLMISGGVWWVIGIIALVITKLMGIQILLN